MKQLGNPMRTILFLTLWFWSAAGQALDAGADTDSANAIQSVTSEVQLGGKVVLSVEMKSPLEATPTSFAINNPPRIIFDFPNTKNDLGKSQLEFGEGDVRSASLIEAAMRSRLVLNLSKMMAYESRLEGNTLQIVFQQKAAKSTGSGAAVFEVVGSSQQKHSLRDVDFRRGKNGEGRVQVDLSDAGVGIDIKRQGRQLMVDFQRTSLPRNLHRKLDVTDFGTSVQMVDAFPLGENVRLAIEPKGSWEYSAYQTDNKFIIEVKEAVEDPNKRVKGLEAGYVGDKLTLNFQNITTREALSVIADFTNLNMVISDTVAGNLTLRLKDVPWDQALDIILQSKGLDMRKNGNVVQIAPREEIAAKEKLSFSAQQEITELEPVRTESFQLNYAKAMDMVKLLKSKDSGLLSKRGSAVADIRTNTLFVQEASTRLDEIRNVLKELDVPVRQVLIEARFVEATDSFTRTIGGRLGYTGPETSVAGGGFPLGPNSGVRGAMNPTVNLPPTPSFGGLTYILFNSIATKTLTLELNASELDGRTKSIASPRVVTGDKLEATIESGVDVPYITSSNNGTQTQFKKAVLGLTVTPQITPDDRVNMKIMVSQDTVGNIYGGVPSINTKRVDTTVLVENGGTVVIGGVYTQNEGDSTEQVPLFGDIPVLGWFFKNNTVDKSKRELLVFITPKILKESLGIN